MQQTPKPGQEGRWNTRMRDAAEDGIAAASVYIGLGCCGNTGLVTSYLNNTSRKKPQHCAKFFVLSVISAFYQLTV